MKSRKIKIKTVKTRPETTDADKEIPKNSSASRKVQSKAVTLKRKSIDQSAQQNDARSIIEKNIAKRRKISVESAVVSAPKQSVTSKSTKVSLDFSSKDEELTNTEASLENCDSNSLSTENETKKSKAERKAEKAAKKLKKKKKKAKKAKKLKKEKRQEESHEEDRLSVDFDDSDFEKETMEYEKRSKKKLQKSSRSYRRSESYEEEEKIRYRDDRMHRRNHKSSLDRHEGSHSSKLSSRRHHRDDYSKSRRVIRDKKRNRYRSRS